MAPTIWIVRLRIDRGATFRVSGSKISNAAAATLGMTVVVEASAGVIVLAVEDSAVTASEAADLAAEAALADSAAVEDLEVFAGAGDDDNSILELCTFISRKNSNHKINQKENMKKMLTLTSIVSIGAVVVLLTACQTTGAGAGESARKEALLSQSGFKVITVTDPKQQQAINGLAENRCSAVTYNGKLYYVFPTATKDKIYVGKQAQFNKYKKALAAQKASNQATM